MDQLDRAEQAGIEIEVTEEMVESGLLALQSSFDDVISTQTQRARSAVRDIYRLMRGKQLSVNLGSEGALLHNSDRGGFTS